MVPLGSAAAPGTGKRSRGEKRLRFLCRETYWKLCSHSFELLCQPRTRPRRWLGLGSWQAVQPGVCTLHGPCGRSRSSAGACSSARCKQPLRPGSRGQSRSARGFCWSLFKACFVVGLGSTCVTIPACAAGGQARTRGARSSSHGGSLGCQGRTRWLGCSARCSRAAFLEIWRGSRSWAFAMAWVEGPMLCQVQQKQGQLHRPCCFPEQPPSLAAWTWL